MRRLIWDYTVYRSAYPYKWREALSTPEPTKEQALRVLEKEAQKRVGDHEMNGLRVVWNGEIWQGKAIWNLPKPDPDDWIFNPRGELTMELTTEGKASFKESESDEMFPAYPFAIRDLDGDGEREWVWSDDCAQTAKSTDGGYLRATVSRCCGC